MHSCFAPVEYKVTRYSKVTYWYNPPAALWHWILRNTNVEDPRDGVLAVSKGGFHSLDIAQRNFKMTTYWRPGGQEPSGWLIGGLLVAIAVAIALLSYTGRARAHDIYKDWKVNGNDCCHDVHCFATRIYEHWDGTWWARNHDGSWLEVPFAVIDWTTNYVGSHACIQQRSVDEEGNETPARVLCAAIGGNA